MGRNDRREVKNIIFIKFYHWVAELREREDEKVKQEFTRTYKSRFLVCKFCDWS